MIQNILIETKPSRMLLSFNMRNITQLFPGFQTGDFAVLYGSPSVQSLATLLSIRAQLPPQLGGLGSNVLYIDGANTFQLYQTTRLAKLCQLNPKRTLDHIYISRTFTAYQMASLILQKLEESVKAINAKLIIISDIAAMFLDKDVEEKEAKRIYNQVINRLTKFAKENSTIVIVTYPPHVKNSRSMYFDALTLGQASVVIKINQTEYEKEIILEKHQTFKLGSTELPTEILPITAFLEA